MDASILSAWKRGLAAVGSSDGLGYIGWLGEAGPDQRLTLVPDFTSGLADVAKVDVGARARDLLCSEYQSLSYAYQLGYRYAPRCRFDEHNNVLLLERLDGQHPSWRDPGAQDWLLGGASGIPFRHGDTTPWNIVACRDKFMLLDWEKADPAAPFRAEMAFLDYVLRGAAAAHAWPVTVKKVLAEAIDRHIIDRAALTDSLSRYGSYRREFGIEGDGLFRRTLLLAMRTCHALT